jgi:O-antigen ligase
MTSSNTFVVLLTLFGLSLCVSISATEMCVGILLVWWLARFIRDRRTFAWRVTPLNKPLLFFFLWGVLCVMMVRPREWWNAVTGPAALVLFYWASQCLDRDDVETLLKWICWGGAVAGLVGVLQAVSGINWVSAINDYDMPARFRSAPAWFLHYFSLHNNRAMGTRSHPLTYAECLIPAFFLLLHFCFQAWRQRPLRKGTVIARALAVMAVAGGVLASQSRGVWAGLAVGFVAYAFALGRRFFLSAMAAGVIAAGVLFAVAPPSVKGRLLSVVSSSAGTQGDQWSKQTRYELWTRALEQLKTRPLTGVGLNGVALRVKQPMDPAPRIWTETHNLYLQALLETGLVGFGLLLWVLVICARVLWTMPASWRPAFGGLFVAFLVAGLTESWTHDKEVSMLFWLLIGCAAALRHSRESAGS